MSNIVVGLHIHNNNNITSRERKKIGSAIRVIFISLSRNFFWLQKVSEDRILRRLEMMMVPVITEGSGAAESGHLLIEGDILLTTFRDEGE